MSSADIIERKTAEHFDAQDRWNDLFATKLIEVLDKIDTLRSDVAAEIKRAHRASLAEQQLIAHVNEAERIAEDFRSAFAGAQMAADKFDASAKLMAEAEEKLAWAALHLRQSSEKHDEATEILSVATASYATSEARQLEATEKLATADGRFADASKSFASAEVILTQSVALARDANQELREAKSDYNEASAMLAREADRLTSLITIYSKRASAIETSAYLLAGSFIVGLVVQMAYIHFGQSPSSTWWSMLSLVLPVAVASYFGWRLHHAARG